MDIEKIFNDLNKVCINENEKQAIEIIAKCRNVAIVRVLCNNAVLHYLKEYAKINNMEVCQRKGYTYITNLDIALQWGDMC